jgi:hypothetical protein
MSTWGSKWSYYLTGRERDWMGPGSGFCNNPLGGRITIPSEGNDLGIPIRPYLLKVPTLQCCQTENNTCVLGRQTTAKPQHVIFDSVFLFKVHEVRTRSNLAEVL